MRRFDYRFFMGTLILSVLLASGAVAQTPGLTDNPAWQPDNPRPGNESTLDKSTTDEPATIAERLFAAVLDRFPSDLEHEQAAQQIDSGQIDALASTLLGSSEYRRLRATKTPNTLLEQFFLALLDRAPDQAAYRRFSQELSRGNDAGVLRALLESDEFDETIAGQSLEAGPLETACMQAVEQRLSNDLGRTTKLQFLTVATSKQSFIAKETRGTAKLSDGRGVDFACTSERLTDSIVDVAYQIAEAEEERALVVRCESLDQRRRECPADTSGGVTMVRQLGRTQCRQNYTWGSNERGIWVDRGCRADFQVMGKAGRQPLELLGEGTGFLYQEGSPAVWFDRARVECEPDGPAQITFTGRNTVALSGECYQLNEDRLELDVSGSSGEWYTEGGGSVTVAGGSLGDVSVAGRSRYGQAFTITFQAGSSLPAAGMSQAGEGLLEVADGRRVAANAVRVEPQSDGRVTFSFEGEARFAFEGTWFETWSGGYEVTVNGGINDSSTRGAGRVHWLEDGSISIDLVGTADTVGGAFRVSFTGRASG